MITETFVKYTSMVSLMILGIFMIYEGARYIDMRRTNPDIPESIYAAAVLSIFVGFGEFIFGLAHYWF